jgi:hypothetical protein
MKPEALEEAILIASRYLNNVPCSLLNPEDTARHRAILRTGLLCKQCVSYERCNEPFVDWEARSKCPNFNRDEERYFTNKEW